ncbi:S26 family signal peptidase [Actinomadura rudentiformis]|uniref:S26 family signal peptidase n=1 Tax=Actinomadura rudentiformis TaxID=359158 RepID=UPI00178C43BB
MKKRPAKKRLSLAACLAPIALLLALARRYLLLVTVRGGSMKPTLVDGERLLMVRVPGRSVRPGDIVAIRNPDGAGAPYPLLVKRVAAVADDPVPPHVPTTGESRFVPAEHLVVLGDWPHSRDSRAWGCIPNDLVIGVAVRRKEVIDALKVQRAPQPGSRAFATRPSHSGKGPP